MLLTQSPWLQQLKRVRPVLTLNEDTTSDVVIVGAGISGMVTAFFVLKDTTKRVLLIEADKVAHGATGHNAGQLVSYFERPFSEMVDEYGLPLVAKAQYDILSAWELLEEIYNYANLQTPFVEFTGYAGCRNLKEILLHLENKLNRSKVHIRMDSILIAENAPFLEEIPQKYKDLYAVVPQKDILDLLETDNHEYYATLTARKGCLNSALFTEELAGFLLKTYPERFQLVEHTPVRKITLHQDYAELETDSYAIEGQRVILCTNGFENIEIISTNGADINSKFHELVHGIVSYMAGYLSPLDKPPTAITYFDPTQEDQQNEEDLFQTEPYFYLTRRPYEMEKNEHHNLICIGGPEMKLEDKASYSKFHHYPTEPLQKIDTFLHKNYKHAPKNINYTFRWHGLMGYTPSGIRCIGPEPCNEVLLYNLGCNGVGILPSIYGGKRISLFLQYKKLEPSLFDPMDKSCILVS